jgi:DivIVA domain-containing protein
MQWVFALLGVGLVTALGLVLAGRLPPVPQPTRQPRITMLPEHPSAADVDQLRLPVAFRGYRMEDVDATLTVLRNRIAELEVSAPQPPNVTGAPNAFAPEDPATDR